MKLKFLRIVFCGLAALVLLCISCDKPKPVVTRGFYYWKNTRWNLTDEEDSALQSLGTQKLYVKFFEVEQNEALGAIPSVKMQVYLSGYFRDRRDSVFGSHLEIIPVVFVRNEVLHTSSNGALDTLADNINFLVGKYYKHNVDPDSVKPLQEIQIDCDWTIQTKDKYFYLLRALKKISGKTLSCTLRLYPYKYRKEMGIPPVDKATLMCYNLLPALKSETQNSILDVSELKKYLTGTPKYPLHLDVALPVFSWMQVYHNGNFEGMVGVDEIDPQNLRQKGPLWYEVINDCEAGSFYFRQGDEIKLEDVPENTLDDAISAIKQNVALDDSITVTLFHLDNSMLKKYNHVSLARFYAAFAGR